MNRAEILKHYHKKVVEENLPEEEEKQDMNAGPNEHGLYPEPHTVCGPFTQATWWEGRVDIQMIREDYEVSSNLTLLEDTASEDIPVKVVWGIGGWWQWELTIPLDATEPEDCSAIGSSGE